METVLLFVAGGVILTLGAMFVYIVVVPSKQARHVIQKPMRPGRQCVYCRSTNTRRLSQEPRYDDYGFALVTAYECVRCGLPFWRVDRSRQQQHSH